MAAGIILGNVGEQHDVEVGLPQFLSARQFILACTGLLRSGFDEYDVCKAIFQHYCSGDFDGHLDALLPVFGLLAETDILDDGWGDNCCINGRYLSYPEAALNHYKKLKESDHHQAEIALNILEMIVASDSDYDYPPDEAPTSFPSFHTPEQFIQECMLLVKRLKPNECEIQTHTLSEFIFVHYCNGDFDDNLYALRGLVESLAACKHFYRSPGICFRGIALSRYKQLNNCHNPQSNYALDILETVITTLSYEHLSYRDCPGRLPPFICSEQFIDYCQDLLCESDYPHREFEQKTCLWDLIWHHYYRGDFDNHLKPLLPLIQMCMQQSGGAFKEVVGELDVGDVSENSLSYQEAALHHYRKLKLAKHPQLSIASEILKMVTGHLDLDGCLEIGYFEQLPALLRNTKPNPYQRCRCNGDLMENIFWPLVHGQLNDCMEIFPDLVRALLECGASPNYSFSNIVIKDRGTYSNPTCLHVTYLYWQLMKDWFEAENEAKWVKEAFFLLLSDPRVDVTAQFTESNLNYSLRHFPGDKDAGHLRGGNLAHHALIEGDLKTCQKVLSIAPHLIHSNCRITSSTKEHWEGNTVKRFHRVQHREVSLCHIAARNLDSEACTFLATLGGTQHVSQDELLLYAQLYQNDVVARHSRRIYNRDFQATLEIAAQAESLLDFNKVKRAIKLFRPLPQSLPTPFYTYRRAGYDVMYDPRTKCPIVREVLHKEALEPHVSNNIHQGFRQDPLIPQINRSATSDFAGSGMARGHARPRADALVSADSLYDSGYLTNIMPQDPTLNNGLWKKLENQVRDWAQTHFCLHVYTGCTFIASPDQTLNIRVIGDNQIHVPTHVFKVIYTYRNNRWCFFSAYLIPNRPLRATHALRTYLTDEETMQRVTGVNFTGFYNQRV